jgi:Tol biopolymer transport system component
MMMPGQFRLAAWLTNSDIVFSAPKGQAINLWLLPETELGTGNPLPLTQGASINFGMDASGSRFVFECGEMGQSIWRLPADLNRGIVKGAPVPLVQGNGQHQYSELSRDGTLLAYATYTSQQDLWIRNLETGTTRFLPAPSTAAHLVFSPEGTRIAYQAFPELQIIPASGGESTSIMNISGDQFSRTRGWSSDGRFLLLWRVMPTDRIAVVDLEKKVMVDIITAPARRFANPRLSPDGRWVAFQELHSTGTAILLAPFRGAMSIPEAELLSISATGSLPIWSPDGNALYYMVQSTTGVEILRQPLDPVSRKPKGEPGGFFRFPDGTAPNTDNLVINTPVAGRDQLIYGVQQVSADIWVLEREK